MRAYVIQAGSKTGSITTLPIPAIPSPNHALIRILRAGICNTDLEILQGYMGFSGTLGHEFVGVVHSLHETTSRALQSEWVGQRVCGDINVGCQSCGVCTDSLGYNEFHSQMRRNHCPNRSVLGILKKDGTFGEYMILPLGNLHKVPTGMKDEVAVFAEPLAAACRIVEQSLVHFSYAEGNGNSNQRKQARGGDRVAILGDGKLGLCVAEILGREYLRCCCANDKDKDCIIKDSPPPPILFGKHQHKLDLVSDSGVKTRLVSECYQDEEQQQLSPSHANIYDVVIDATGNPNGLTLAMNLCRPMGTLVLKSTCAAGVKGFHSAPIVIDELTVVGSRCGPIDRALELLSIEGGEGVGLDNGIPPLNMEKYITKTFPLSQTQEALEFAALKSTMKVQLVMSEE